MRPEKIISLPAQNTLLFQQEYKKKHQRTLESTYQHASISHIFSETKNTPYKINKSRVWKRNNWNENDQRRHLKQPRERKKKRTARARAF